MDKLNEILTRISNIEKHLGIGKEVKYKNMKPAYDIKEVAILLGCSASKVRKYIEYGFLEKFKIGRKVMILSDSINKLIEDNKKSLSN